MAKTRLRAPRPVAKKRCTPLTLAHVTIRWKEGARTVECSGATLAQLLTYHRARNPYSDAVRFDGESVRAVASLRGLSGLLFADAGAPHGDLERDQRFFVSETLAELAATVDADTCDPRDAERFVVIAR